MEAVMRALIMLLGTALLAVPGVANAQGAGPTQSRDGLGNAAHPLAPSNSMPAGSLNANGGPQSRPAYPSGSTSRNPGAAFVRDQPKPATGALAKPPGDIATTTIQGGRAIPHPASPGVGEERAGRTPPGVH